MKVNYAAQIHLSADELKVLLSRQKNSRNRQKIQMLYWLKSGSCQSITQVAQLLGIHRITVQRWFKKYRDGGGEKLLEIPPIPGRHRSIPPSVMAKLQEKLEEESGGFKSYKEILQWVEENFHLKIKYRTLHQQVRYGLKAKLKVPRPSSVKKDPTAAIDFKKNSRNC